MPIHNAAIARVFDEVADLLEIQGSNPFRVRAYRNASRIVSALPSSVATMLEAGEDLQKLGGIGKDPGKTLTIVRTDLGADLLASMEADGWITTADATVEDPDAVALVERLAAAQKQSWPIPAPEPA